MLSDVALQCSIKAAGPTLPQYLSMPQVEKKLFLFVLGLFFFPLDILICTNL